MFNSRADLESFFKWGGRLWYILLFIAFVLFASLAHADEPPVKVFPFPAVCMEKKVFSTWIGPHHLAMVWQGMKAEQELVTLWEDVLESGWIITSQVAGNPLICIIATGDKGGLVGEEL